MFNNPFRADASARKEHQQLDRLLRTTAPHERAVLAAIGLILLAFAGWARFGSIGREVAVAGVVTLPGARHEIVSGEPGRLVEFLAAPGDAVEPGTPVARQTAPELEREIAALRDRIALLEAEIRNAGGGRPTLRSLAASGRETLLTLESRRAAREMIASHAPGEVVSLLAAPGDHVGAGVAVARVRDRSGGHPEAVAAVPPRVARRMPPGMAASVAVAMPDGSLRRVRGEVARVVAGTTPDWLRELGLPGADAGHLVHVVLHEALEAPEGASCRVRLALGRGAPIELLASDGS